MVQDEARSPARPSSRWGEGKGEGDRVGTEFVRAIEAEPPRSGETDSEQDEEIRGLSDEPTRRHATRRRLDAGRTTRNARPTHMNEASPSTRTQRLMRKLLSEEEVRLISRQLRKVMGPVFMELSGRYGLNIEHSIRFQAVATRLREAREKRGIELKTAATALRVPQYRLREMEECRVRAIEAPLLQAYIDFLGLRQWFARWRTTNSKLAARLGLGGKSKVK